MAPPPAPVVVAPAPFKGALSASAAARAIAAGVRLAATGVETRVVPVADGGEGTLDALLGAAPDDGVRRVFTVEDPLGRPVGAALGMLRGGTAVVELAQASGFERLIDGERDPEATSTFGTGEMIGHALDLGARRVIVGVGGSATCDGGLGIARALGARILDGDGRELRGTGGDLGRVARIDVSGLDPRLAGVDIEVACDVRNPICGPDGAAPVFAPQKGAGPDAVARLDDGLRRLAEVMARDGVADVGAMPMAGAAGGAAGGMAALLGARLVPGADVVLRAVHLAERLEGAGLCITGEGALDPQTAEGKAPAAVAAACGAAGVPCVAVAGRVDLLPGLVRRLGFAAALPVNRALRPLPDALAEAETELAAMGAALGGLLAALGG